MKASVFHKPKDIRCENVPDPIIKDSRDAIIRVTATAICAREWASAPAAMASAVSRLTAPTASSVARGTPSISIFASFE